MSASLVGAIVVTAAVFFVLWPLLVAHRTTPHEMRSVPPTGDPAVHALRELEFDRETGKLGQADYERLKAAYTARAMEEARGADTRQASAGAPGTDDAEALIAAARSDGNAFCAACGAKCPETDAAFCSTCGARLAVNRG